MAFLDGIDMPAPALLPNIPRILIIEDDAVLAAHLSQYLHDSGFEIICCSTAQEGLAAACSGSFDLILMDVMLPGDNGLRLLEQLRHSRKVPVILMSALGAEQDRIAGFSRGADDYLPKPFSLGEMGVRIEAVLRRVAYEREQTPAEEQRDPQLECADNRMDVRIGQQWAGLTATEYRLLTTFLHYPEEPLSKAFLYQQVLHRPYLRHDRVLDMHISHLRRKLQNIGYQAGRLDTVWGRGYVLTRLAT